MNDQNKPYESYLQDPYSQDPYLRDLYSQDPYAQKNPPSRPSAPEGAPQRSHPPRTLHLVGPKRSVPEPKHPRFFLFLNGWLEAFTTSMVIVTLLFTFLFRSVSVDGKSMQSSLMDDDRLIVSGVVSGMLYRPARGDIVVIIPTEAMPRALIKRVVALEGETIDIIRMDGEGQVLINGNRLEEPYLDADKHIQMNEGDAFHAVVPKGHVFVMGDNRNNSTDSRSQQVGTVDVRLIMGKALFRMQPLNRFGLLYNNLGGGIN